MSADSFALLKPKPPDEQKRQMGKKLGSTAYFSMSSAILMNIFNRLFKRKHSENESTERASQGSIQIATATLDLGEALRQRRDIWLVLASDGSHEAAFPVLRAGDGLPSMRSLILTNEVSNIKHLIFRVTMGTLPSEEALQFGCFRPRQVLRWNPKTHESESTDIAVVTIAGNRPAYRLLNHIPVEILIGEDGIMHITASYGSGQGDLSVKTTTQLTGCNTNSDDEAKRPNCREWEGWMSSMSKCVLGNRFEISEVLAEGGFGSIYVVFDRSKDRECHLLKALKPNLSSDPEAQAQFRSEIDLWKSLKTHLNIVSLTGIHESDGKIFAAMPWIVDSRVGLGASTLSAHLNNNHTRGFALDWASDFCSGMLHLRSCGLRGHLDIKPDNLFIMPPHRPLDYANGTEDTRAGMLKIGDFGLSVRKEDAISKLGLRTIDSGTKANGHWHNFSYAVAGGRTILGTLGYMAPEIFDGKIAWERSDIYSFGVVLWQILANTTGLPYRDHGCTNIFELATQIYQQQMAGCFPAHPGPVGDIVTRCLDPDPGSRYPSFRELLSALQAVPPSNNVPLSRAISSELLTVLFPESFNAQVMDDGTIWIANAADDQWAVIVPFPTALENNDALRLEALSRIAGSYKYFEQTWCREATWAELPAVEVEGVWSVNPSKDWDGYRKQDTVFHAWAVSRGKYVFVFHYGVSRREAGGHASLLKRILAATKFR